MSSAATVMLASAGSSASSSSSDSHRLLATLTRRFKDNSAQARSLFLGNYASSAAVPLDERSASTKLRVKIAAEYAAIEPLAAASSAAPPSTSNVGRSSTALKRPARIVEEATGVLRTVEVEEEADNAANRPLDTEELLQRLPSTPSAAPAAASSSSTSAVVAYAGGSSALVPASGLTARQMLIQSKREIEDVRPEWHAPWKLQRVISHAHTGWVRAIAVDHSNEWFVTGSADRTIKIFDLASGNLKLTLTGHISGVRGLAVSKYTPYMFSIGEDKQLFCWDMEVNKTIRSYHGHLSGGYCVSLLEDQAGVNILVSGGRDSVGRVWDVRTASEVAVLTGHTQTVASLQTQMSLPQVITGSHDTTIKLWDLRKTSAPLSTLTHHKKSVRALQLHHTEYTFTSGAGDNLKVWKCPEGTFLRNISGHNATINALALNRENVLVSGADNGSIRFWDYKSGHCFQQYQTIPQPGSLDAESGIFAMAFDMTGSRLFTAETDKSIKVFKEDENATQETHPLDWKPGNKRRRL